MGSLISGAPIHSRLGLRMGCHFRAALIEVILYPNKRLPISPFLSNATPNLNKLPGPKRIT